MGITNKLWPTRKLIFHYFWKIKLKYLLFTFFTLIFNKLLNFFRSAGWGSLQQTSAGNHFTQMIMKTQKKHFLRRNLTPTPLICSYISSRKWDRCGGTQWGDQRWQNDKHHLWFHMTVQTLGVLTRLYPARMCFSNEKQTVGSWSKGDRRPTTLCCSSVVTEVRRNWKNLFESLPALIRVCTNIISATCQLIRSRG